ncbi:ComEC/Rec2 family competence protein [Cellulomonas composti]|uniref:ComEC/Rec2-related protein domain-containing protein n=1 Tax=Cellulomonas composti TaxID=266130 RepID=A0A511JDZ8_9CELL|nr:ComEC/Rec2 family competence protein [Cellulomonas composti]GEL96205.1 hypothetical protein CCO02nite_28630 [Cellulomonas composti]
MTARGVDPSRTVDRPRTVDPPRTVDVRLVPVAAAAWLGALAAVRAPAVTGAVAGTGLAVLAVVCLVVAIRADRDGRPVRVATCALVLAGAAAVLLAGSAHVAERGPLRALAAQGAHVVVEGVVSGDVAELPPAWPGAAPRLRWQLEARTAVANGVRHGVRGPIVVLTPDEGARPVDGARVRLSGALRPTAPGERATALLLGDAAPEAIGSPPSWRAAATRLRTALAVVAARLPGDAGALLPAVAVGDTSAVQPDLSDAMRTAGLTHLVAVSGAHFALVGALVLAATAALGAGTRLRVGVTVLACAALVVVVHPVPSVVRAAAMGAVAVLGMLVGRRARAVAALGTAVVVLLVVDPWLAGELGFALSVAATAALVLLGGPLAARWSGRLGHAGAAALAAPVAAQLVCGPLVLLAAPAVSPWSVPANLLAGPAVAPATVLGLVAALLAPWWPAAAAVPAAAAGAACWWIAAVARVTASAPAARLEWLPGPLGVVLLVVASGATARVLLARRASRDPP